MRLYTLTGATQVDDPVHGTFEAGPDGEFYFPDELSDHLHSHHIDGQPAWETDAERVERLRAKQLEEMRDPATLLAAVQALASHQADLAAAVVKAQQPADDRLAPAPAEPAAPAELAAAKPAAKTAGRRTSRRSSPPST